MERAEVITEVLKIVKPYVNEKDFEVIALKTIVRFAMILAEEERS